MWMVVDDERILPLSGDGITVRTVEQAIMSYTVADYIDTLYLDHDLGPGQDIMVFVNLLAEDGFYGKDKVGCVVVHSMNPVGVDNIVSKLQKYYAIERRPYHTFRGVK